MTQAPWMPNQNPAAAPTAQPAQAWRQPAPAPTTAPAATGGIGRGFAAINDAEPGDRTPYFPSPLAGAVVEVVEFKAVESKNPNTLGHSKLVFLGKILQADDNPAIVGMVCLKSIDVSNYGAEDAQRLLAAAVGRQGKEQLAELKAQGMFLPESIATICGPTQPLRGRKLVVRTAKVTKVPQRGKNAGKEVTYNDFEAFPYQG